MATELSICGACAAENPGGARFCNGCGAPLLAVEPHDERKLVSVLFVDLVGFTASADGGDPEDVRDALQLFHAEAKRHIEIYGGVVEKFIGDAVMAVFGAPTAHGDDAERAVRAGLRVLASLGELNERHGLQLAARAAVNTGEAVVTVDGAPGDPLATGDVVNTASRLQSAAPEGRLIVGTDTYRATRDAIGYEAAPPIVAKGKRSPVSAWIARGPYAEGAQARRGARQTTLVGRSNEVTLLTTLCSTAIAARRPHLVTMVGPPGIGKSRLCGELAELVEGEGGRIVRGRCLPYEVQVGYQAFSRLVRSACGIIETDPLPLAAEKLRSYVADRVAAAEVEEAHRYLSVLLGFASDVDVPSLHPLYYAARRFVETVGLRAAHRVPVRGRALGEGERARAPDVPRETRSRIRRRC